MKKRIYWVMTILSLAFIFTGCGGGDNGTTIFEKGITDLEINQGTGPGELTYSFSATDPAAESYTLYFLEGENNTAEEIISGGDTKQVEPASADSPGTITGLNSSTTYSIVVVAVDDNFGNTISNIRQAATAQSKWTRGLTDLVIQQGASLGQLTYSFSATDPVADTYTLYYLEGTIIDAQQIIDDGTDISVTPASIASPGVITGLKNGMTYSIVVVAAKSGFFKGITSALRQSTTVAAFAATPVVTLSRTEEGALNYVITPAAPADGVSYTLYYRDGNRNQTVLLNPPHTQIPISAGNLSGTITGLNNSTVGITGNITNANYSVLVVAHKDGYVDAVSPVAVMATFARWHSTTIGLSLNRTTDPSQWSFEITRPITYIGILGGNNYGSQTLYFAEGNSFANAQAVIDAAIAAGTTRTAVTGTIIGLNTDSTYSFVVEATSTNRKPLRTAVQTISTASVEVWTKFNTVTETFENFMGPKFDSGMNAIRTVEVRSEAEAVLVRNASGVSLTYTERTIFIPSGLFSTAWGPMQGRYPIEMWTELRERTDDGIRDWIKGGHGTGSAHGQVDQDLVWTIETGLLGAGAATGWGIFTVHDYDIGGGAALNCSVNTNNSSYVLTITIPLDDYFYNTDYFELDDNEVWAKIDFNPIISDILKTSKFFQSDAFTMERQ